MSGYELRIRICVLNSFESSQVYDRLSKFVSFAMSEEEVLKNLHKSDGMKLYCFSGLVPFEKESYFEGEIYDFYLRSFDINIINAFRSCFIELENQDMMVLDVELINRKIQNVVDSLYTATPVVISLSDRVSEFKYWTPTEEYMLLEEGILYNLVKKFNAINGTNVTFNKEDIFSEIKLSNKFSIKIPYKNANLLGNFFELKFKETLIAQSFASIAYFLGIGTRNSSAGCGFCRVNYKKVGR